MNQVAFILFYFILFGPFVVFNPPRSRIALPNVKRAIALLNASAYSHHCPGPPYHAQPSPWGYRHA